MELMPYVRSTGCCALIEIDNLSYASSPEEALKTVFLSVMRTKPSFVLFSGVTTRRGGDHTLNSRGRTDNYGDAFKTFIEAQGLGSVVKTEERVNPKTANGVTIWIWHTDMDALKKWGKTNDFVEIHNEFGRNTWQPAPPIF